MNGSIRKIVMLFLLAASAVGASAQPLKDADKAFANEEYYKAIELYKALIPTQGIKKDKGYVKYRIGECYRRINDPEQAVGWFIQAEEESYLSPALLYSKAEMLNHLGRYDEARGYLVRYRELKPTDDRIGLKLSALDFAQSYPKENPHVTLKPLEAINTSGSEFGLAYFKEGLIYASTGEKAASSNEAIVSMRTGMGYSKIYFAPIQNGSYKRGVELKEFNVARSNDGTFSYDPNSQLAYYTRCEPLENECYIYYAKLEAGKWKEKGKLKIDSKILQMAHPSVSPNGNRIYFSAMIEGGFGGSDIWYIERDNKGSWGKAINAGRDVNTSGNEVFPFVTNNVLFFSSDGHKGYGGLDIYASKIEHGSHGKAINLRPPFNTSYDDFNLIVRTNNQEGMLVSNRRNKESSDDIYIFNGFPAVFVVSGYVIDKQTGNPMPRAKLVFSNDGDAEEEVLADENGYYYAFLKSDASYTIASDENEYDPVVKLLSTKDMTFPMEFNVQSGYETDFYLEKEKILRSIAGRVYDKETGQPLISEAVYLLTPTKKAVAKLTNAKGEYKFDDIEAGVGYSVRVENKNYFALTKTLKPISESNKATLYSKANGHDMDLPLDKIKVGVEIEIKDIYYNLNKADLLPESKVELEKVVSFFNENPGLKIQISSHTDARGSDPYNQKLSEARAKSVVDYLVENGISQSRLTAIGYGKKQLRIKDAKAEEEHRQNRRTTFKVLEIGEIKGIGEDSFVFVEDKSEQTTEQKATPTVKNTPASSQNAEEGLYTVQVSIANKLDMTDPKIRKIQRELNTKVWTEKGKDNRYRYYVGKYGNRNQATDIIKRLKEIGIVDSFIRELSK